MHVSNLFEHYKLMQYTDVNMFYYNDIKTPE